MSRQYVHCPPTDVNVTMQASSSYCIDCEMMSTLSFMLLFAPSLAMNVKISGGKANCRICRWS
ncbi:hypothetical protein M427DRAFT_132744 [Gonapodya prolifera JEL478]|uniref:Uncharacterized protein n=1 Tax=Gonapodya prolifera (strain JEL478) TaxID=1344416 RepID=A0A139ANS3_GONPJ|nr:hypothetical protein M427DRAFT_132744 [Gonapodya prolifera JEL478]|eukprot:KXS18382.1 hypothetical protein M427DRAFT_132744 [Gonapodya prolifera JEL478]